jgi:hypothetical protein
VLQVHLVSNARRPLAGFQPPACLVLLESPAAVRVKAPENRCLTLILRLLPDLPRVVVTTTLPAQMVPPFNVLRKGKLAPSGDEQVRSCLQLSPSGMNRPTVSPFSREDQFRFDLLEQTEAAPLGGLGGRPRALQN